MGVQSHIRGHRIFYDGLEWRYSDNKKVISSENRLCIKCNRLPTPEGYDACLGHIDGIASACCGHGIITPIELEPRLE